MTKEELFSKVDWEGGIWSAINEYGLGLDALPEDAPAEVVEAWKAIQAASAPDSVIADWLYS